MKKAILFLVIIISACQLYGQETKKDSAQNFVPRIDTAFVQKKSFDLDLIKDLKANEDFIYEQKESEPGLLQRFWNWLKRAVRNLLRSIFDDVEPVVGVLASILRVIPYIILVVGLFFIIKYFANVSGKSIIEGKNESIVNFANDQELLQREDLEKLLAEAIEQKDYRLAIRFYYLIVLKKLRDSNIIDWQDQKTNEDYIREMSNQNYVSEFINSTRLYDFVWYGKFEIDRKRFEEARKSFKLLTDKIV